MNIGEVVKKLQIKHPSVTISRIRFLEKEGLVNIKRSQGGTRKFSNKDIEKISKIIYLQETEFYSLKAIKNNPSLLKSNKSKTITIDTYSLRDLLKQAGITKDQYNELISFGFEDEKDEFSNNDLNRLKSWSYFYSIGLEPKNFSVLKSINERSIDFVEFINSLLPDDSSAVQIAVLDVHNIINSSSSFIQIGEGLNVNGSIQTNGSVTAGTSFIIGDADINETDLEKLDGITNGAGLANKALVLDGSADVASGLRNLTATGTITAPTVDTNVLQSTDSTAIQVNEGLNVSGTLSPKLTDAQNLKFGFPISSL